jgi:hypothetical protein
LERLRVVAQIWYCTIFNGSDLKSRLKKTLDGMRMGTYT